MSLFIGRLPRDMRPSELEDIFHRYGRVTRCDIKAGGYGFVEYEDQRDAEDALKACDGMRFADERIVVEWARGPKKSGAEECFKCGKTGHWARSCPTADSREGTRDFGRENIRRENDRDGARRDYVRRDDDRSGPVRRDDDRTGPGRRDDDRSGPVRRDYDQYDSGRRAYNQHDYDRRDYNRRDRSPAR